MRNTPWPAHVHPWAWLAGVWDGAGRCVIRPSGHTVVQATVEKGTAERAKGVYEHFQVLKRANGRRTLVVPTEQQEGFLRLLLPFLRATGDSASRVLRWRLTVQGRPRVSQAKREFREGLISKGGGDA